MCFDRPVLSLSKGSARTDDMRIFNSHSVRLETLEACGEFIELDERRGSRILLENQHCVAVAIETISLFDRFFVGATNRFDPCEG